MRKRILHFLWNGQVGGAQQAVFHLVRAQLMQGSACGSEYLPVVAFAQARGPLFDKIKGLGCEVIDLNLSGEKRALPHLLRIRKAIARFPVHHFHSAEITLIAASLLCRGTKRIFTQRGGYYPYTGKQKWRYRLVGFYLRHFFHALSGNTNHACVSAARLFRMDPAKWSTTYNGTDFSFVEPGRSREQVASEIGIPLDGTFTIGTSAQLRSWKRIDLLLKACAKSKKPFRLLVIGDGPARSELQDLADELQIADRTYFLGEKPKVGDYLNLCDAFALPSMGLESFGNAAVEAMARGIPTMVFQDGGGLVEHIEDGVSGYIVSSVDELSSRLDQLSQDKGLAQQIGKAARTRVTTRYTYERMVNAYDQVYDQGTGA